MREEASRGRSAKTLLPSHLVSFFDFFLFPPLFFLRRVCKVVHQEIFFLWHKFVVWGRCGDSGAVNVQQLAEALADRKLSPPVLEGLFRALDLNDDGLISFKDWALCVHKTCRGTSHDLVMMAARLLDLWTVSEAELAHLASELAKAQGTNAEKERLKEEADEIVRVVKKRSVEYVSYYSLHTSVLQCACSFLMQLLAPFVEDMEAKLKRLATHSLGMVCHLQRETVPRAVQVLCVRLDALRMQNPECVNFAPETLYVHRDLVEAVCNAYVYGFAPYEGLPCEVLLMVLRTYLRTLTEPLFTLHVSRVLMSRCAALSASQRVERLGDAVPKLPRPNYLTVRLLVRTAAALVYDDKSLDTLAKILSYCLLRSDAHPAGTSAISMDLTKLLLTHPREIFQEEEDDDDEKTK